MLSPLSRTGNPAATRQIKAWTRDRFSLSDDEVVMVVELACGLPGCPPLETIITFWTAPERRHQFKVFKCIADVREDDFPPYWMKNAILSDGDISCC